MSMSQSLCDFCTANRRSRLLEEWDTEKNAGLSPKDISYGSPETGLVALREGARVAGDGLYALHCQSRVPGLLK